MAKDEDEYSEEEGQRLFDEFARQVADDPYARMALAEAIAEGKFPVSDDGMITIDIDGLNWMEARENELRNQASN